MFNNDGIRKTSYGAPVQILANVEMQYSVGCKVPKTMGTDVDGRKIIKAGTPINIDLTDLTKNVKAAAAGAPMNAVLLHNVDVTDAKDGGTKNGTALIFGFVNVNRVEESVKTAIQTAKAVEGATPLLTFVNV